MGPPATTAQCLPADQCRAPISALRLEMPLLASWIQGSSLSIAAGQEKTVAQSAIAVERHLQAVEHGAPTAPGPSATESISPLSSTWSPTLHTVGFLEHLHIGDVTRCIAQYFRLEAFIADAG